MIQLSENRNSELSVILRTVSLYKALKYEQILKMFPKKQSSMRNLLTRLIKERRIFYDAKRSLITIDEKYEVNESIINCFWVLLDFIDKAEFHTTSDFPVCISFFCNDDSYDIIYVPIGKEMLMNHILATENKENLKRIIVIDSHEQIEKIVIDGVVGYCTVKETGEVAYYKKEKRN